MAQTDWTCGTTDVPVTMGCSTFRVALTNLCYNMLRSLHLIPTSSDRVTGWIEMGLKQGPKATKGFMESSTLSPKPLMRVLRTTHGSTMKIRKVLNGCCMLLFATAQAQQWCPPGATWIYDTGSPWTTALTQYAYTGDTVVDGHFAQRIEVDGQITDWFGEDTVIVTAGPDLVTRLAADVVMLWLPVTQTWDTLYWFGAEVGDRWQPPWAFGEECSPEHGLFVLETGTMNVDGLELRTLLVERRQGAQSIGTPEWIAERIGTLSGYFLPMADCGGVIECYCAFGCYQDQTIQYPSPGQDCAIPTAVVGPPEREAALSVWPNPGYGFLQYVASTGGFVDVMVRDGMGRCVFKSVLSPSRGTLDLSGLAQGAYCITFSNGSAYRQSQVWQKFDTDR